MTRLTKEVRKIICENALSQSPIKEKIITVRQKLEQLAVDIYNDNVTSEQSKEADEMAKRMKELPFICAYGVFKHLNYLTCSFGGMCNYLDLPKTCDFYEIPRADYSAEHKFSKRFNELDQEKIKLLEQLDNTRQEIMAVLNSCQTLKRLLEIWPEASNFLNGVDIVTSKVGLPAVMIEDLNKKLGVNTNNQGN